MVHMVHDGGGVAPLAPPVPQPSTDARIHRADGSETVESLAERYAVSPEAIVSANPQLANAPANGGNPIQAGDELQIPASPQSVTGEVETGDPNHSTTDAKVTLKDDNGSITWQPDSASLKLTDEQKAELGSNRPEGAGKETKGASISLANESSVTLTESRGDDSTSFLVTTQTQVTLSGEATAGGRAGGADVAGSASTGFESTYKVTLPGEATVERAAAVNPFDPTTVPVGGSVTLDSQTFAGTSLEGSFRHIAAKSEIQYNEGVSYTLERVDENTVRVTTGPTETINAFNGVGVKVGDVSALVGREDQLHGATLQTAEFDISTQEGQTALQHFNTTGQIAHTTPGVDNVATIQRLDYSSQTQLRAEAGDLSLVLGGQANLGSSVKVTYPDGSYSLTTDLSYGANVPLTVEQRFDAQGNELPGERRFEFEVSTDRPEYNWLERNILGQNEASEERALAEQLNWAIDGDPSSGRVSPGETVTLSFTESQIETLIGQIQSTVDGNNIAGANNDLALLLNSREGADAPNSMEFAVALARNLGSEPGGFIDKLFRISSGADGDNANKRYDGIDVTVQGG
ncbi:LysM peptidoglycan-binding domain-containing protein [Luteimonas sp. FCS-9]|uniref:LysM peptidoglycan-binding domain-containing protein n=1 Tax=Luteimonas sp. FCS-9 TaxID=1547516 RepID=UPI000699DBD3|nr:LysM peptidoglycan-binding domain-containing protein [Luteimonas sp. FCS-9]